MHCVYLYTEVTYCAKSSCTQRVPIDHFSVGTCCIETTVQRVTCQLQPPTISQCAERNSMMGLLLTFLQGAECSENHQTKVKLSSSYSTLHYFYQKTSSCGHVLFKAGHQGSHVEKKKRPLSSNENFARNLPFAPHKTYIVDTEKGKDDFVLLESVL